LLPFFKELRSTSFSLNSVAIALDIAVNDLYVLRTLPFGVDRRNCADALLNENIRREFTAAGREGGSDVVKVVQEFVV
jgi:hypothetical protein